MAAIGKGDGGRFVLAASEKAAIKLEVSAGRGRAGGRAAGGREGGRAGGSADRATSVFLSAGTRPADGRALVVAIVMLVAGFFMLVAALYSSCW